MTYYAVVSVVLFPKKQIDSTIALAQDKTCDTNGTYSVVLWPQTFAAKMKSKRYAVRSIYVPGFPLLLRITSDVSFMCMDDQTSLWTVSRSMFSCIDLTF